MKKLLKENKGSTLLTTMFFILVVALLTISLHLALISMIDKVTADYDQKQAYVSARGIATAIAEQFETSSAAEYTTLTNASSTAALSGQAYEESNVTLTDEWLTLLDGIAYVGDSETLRDIAIGGVELGDEVTGTIEKISETSAVYAANGTTLITPGTATYLLTITTTYGDETESVSLTINRSTDSVMVSDVEVSEYSVSGGYLQGFYMDTMPLIGKLTYSEDKTELDDALMVCESTLAYVDPDIYFGMKSDFYCMSDVILVDNTAGKNKTINGSDYYKEATENIEFFAKGNIYLENTSVSYADVKSEEDIYLYYDYSSDTMTVKYSTFQCDTLYIYASTTYKFENCTFNVNDIEILSGSSYLSFENCTFNIGNAKNKSEFYEDYDESKSTVSGNYSNGEQTPSITMPQRYVPPYVSAVEQMSGTLIDADYATFTAADDSSENEIDYTIYEIDDSRTTYYFNESNFSGYSDDNAIVVYVPDGVTVTVYGKFSAPGVYFYLEGNANLILKETGTSSSSNGTNYVRIYSDDMTTEQVAVVSSRIESYVGTYTNLRTKSDTQLKTIQTDINNYLVSIQTSYATVTAINDSELTGTVVVNSIASTDYASSVTTGFEIEYEYATSLSDQVISREQWSWGTVEYPTFSVGIYN